MRFGAVHQQGIPGQGNGNLFSEAVSGRSAFEGVVREHTVLDENRCAGGGTDNSTAMV